MLTFSVQQKILGDILKNSSNLHCADCLSKSPTWASLDFGVFLCSNCAGAHRALGPTITRVRSSKLDQWNKDWVQNMKIGNSQLNKYWQNDSSCSLIKPKAGASLEQINRYVVQKYIKKKYVNLNQNKHPLQAYKDGEYKIEKNQQEVQKGKNNSKNTTLNSDIKAEKNSNSNEIIINNTNNSKPTRKFEGDLLEINHIQEQFQKKHQQYSTNDDDDQFTEYHSAETHQHQAHTINGNGNNLKNHFGVHQHQQSHDPNSVKYEDLFKIPQQTNSHIQNHNVNVSQSGQHLHTPINMNSNHFNNSGHIHYNQVNINGHSYINNGYHHQQPLQQPHSYQTFNNFNGNYGVYNIHTQGFSQNSPYNNQYHHTGVTNINMNNQKTYSQVPLNSYQPTQIPTIQSNWTL